MLTKEQTAALTVVTGCLLMEPKYFIEVISEKLNRKVLPEEFTEAFQEELKEIYIDEVKELCWKPPHAGLILLTS